MNDHARPGVYITVNNRKMYLDRMFIKIKEGSFGLNVKAEYVLFTGEDTIRLPDIGTPPHPDLQIVTENYHLED
jgi:hypothetical protein